MKGICTLRNLVCSIQLPPFNGGPVNEWNPTPFMMRMIVKVSLNQVPVGYNAKDDQSPLLKPEVSFKEGSPRRTHHPAHQFVLDAQLCQDQVLNHRRKGFHDCVLEVGLTLSDESIHERDVCDYANKEGRTENKALFTIEYFT